MNNPLYQAAHRRPQAKPLPLEDEPPKPKKPPSTLEAVANVLSLPGSSVLDTVTGHNPFDQWLDPIGNAAETNRTTGRQALRQFGLANDKDTWGNAIAGFAVDAVTDPLTYTGIGVLSKGGKALSKAGLLRLGSGVADTLAAKTTKTVRQVLDEADDAQAALRAFRHTGGTDDMLHQPLHSLVDFRLPGSKGVKWNGPSAQPVAKALDAVADKVLDIPGMRNLRAAFSPAVLNATTKAGQDIAEHRRLAVDDALVDIGTQFAPLVKNNDLDGAKRILDGVRNEATNSGLDLSRFNDTMSPTDLSSALQHSEHLTRASGMAHAATELLGTNARTDGTGVPLTAALKRLGMDTDAARKNLQDWVGDSDLASLSIDENLLEDAGRFVKPYTDPEAIGSARKAIETFNRLFKSHVTMPFPAFHSRNLFSGQLQNVLFGASDPTVKGPLSYVKPLTQAYKLRAGRTLKGLGNDIAEFKELGLTDREATEALNNEIFARGLIGDSQNAADIGKAAPDAATRLPGLPRAANPLLQKGAFNPLKPEVFIPTRLGGDVAGFVEELNRLAPYIAYRKQGYTADAAAELVKKIQVDYSNPTHWETKYGRNFIPFYMFAKGMLPMVAKELAQHPGGPTAQVVKASGRASQDNPQPHWLRGQTTLPISAGGHIGGLGLMHDDAASLLGAAMSGDVAEIAKDVGGRLNPLIKLPIELASGQSLYHGRPYNTVTPDVGGTLHNIAHGTGKPRPAISQETELALRNSPAARYLATLRKLTDPKMERKQLAANLATGLYYGD